MRDVQVVNNFLYCVEMEKLSVEGWMITLCTI